MKNKKENITKMIFSRKLINLVRSNVISLIEGTFTETEIKELLIDLREFIGLLVQKEKGFTGSKLTAMKELLDLCDLVAHPNKNQGPIVENIRLQIDLLKRYTSSATSFKRVNKYKGTGLYGSKLTKDLIDTVKYFLSFTDKPFTDHEYKKIIDNQIPYISACFASLLQNLIISYDPNEKPAHVYLANNKEGQLGLWCLISDAKFVHDISQKLPEYDGLIVNFLVLVTTFKTSLPQAHETASPVFMDTIRLPDKTFLILPVEYTRPTYTIDLTMLDSIPGFIHSY